MNVLAIVAHPDDEIIGVAGTLYNHIQNGDNVKVIIFAEGKSSRCENYEDFDLNTLTDYEYETKNALNILGIYQYEFLALANNRLDSYDFLDIVKKVEKLIVSNSPDVIYTHYYKEMNNDHNILSKAVLTAARPLPGSLVKEILLFETLSSTEYALSLGESFTPNLFVDISSSINIKLEAMNAYKSELRLPPHPRSIELIKKNAELWGAKIGKKAAEAFIVSRILR